MKPDKFNILEAADHRDGMTVPDGYFAEFASKMESMLPETEFERSEGHPDSPVFKGAAPTRWQRVRPYVYMAAMFAGAWCMLKMFSLMSPTEKGISFDNDPMVAAAIGNDQFIDEYFLDDYNQYDLYYDIAEDSIAPDDMMPEDMTPAAEEEQN